MKKLIIISGPSCAGKTPLLEAAGKACSCLSKGSRKLVIYNDRSPRPGEKEGVDYFFRARKEILRLKKVPGFLVMNVRGDLQALDTTGLLRQLKLSNVVFEGNTYMAGKLLRLPEIKRARMLSLFISPLSLEELREIRSKLGAKGLDRYIREMMFAKLLRRAIRQGRAIDETALRDLKRRARCALKEIKEAPFYDHVIPNHDGEDSDNWGSIPVGDARRTINAFLSILGGKSSVDSEKWPEKLPF